MLCSWKLSSDPGFIIPFGNSNKSFTNKQTSFRTFNYFHGHSTGRDEHGCCGTTLAEESPDLQRPAQ